MDKKILNAVNLEDADTLCAQIMQEAQHEIELILDKARRDADKILVQAKQQAQVIREDAARKVKSETAKAQEKIFSTLNLEKKRIILDQKNKFVLQVMDLVKGKAQQYRQDPQYQAFIENAVVEAVKVIQKEQIQLVYSVLDHKIFNADFMDLLSKRCEDALGRKCSLHASQQDWQDIGVMVNSADGRISYDNRFLSRMARIYDNLYMELLKDAF